MCAELSAIYPETPGQETLNQLRCLNLVEVDIHGNYVLTYHGLILRRQIPDQPMPSASPRESRTGHEWDRFRKVVSYYIECVHLQERTQEYLRQKDINKKFFLPIFDIVFNAKFLATAPAVSPKRPPKDASSKLAF